MSGPFDSLSALLPEITAQELLNQADAFAAAIAELAPMIGFDQRSPHHAYDLFTHTALVVEAVPPDLTLRWAALLHDVGKVPSFTTDATGRGHFYGHAKVGAEMADAILRRLEAPEDLRRQAVALIANHMTRLPAEPSELKLAVSQLGWDTVRKLIYLQEADMSSKGMGEDAGLSQFPRLRAALDAIRNEHHL